jgi:uncharacterized membrane protein
MQLAAQIVIGFVALIHIYILWLEMFAWTTRAPKVFKTIPKDLFPQTKTLAANQGSIQWIFSCRLNLVVMHKRPSMEILRGHILFNLCDYCRNLWRCNSK